MNIQLATADFYGYFAESLPIAGVFDPSGHDDVDLLIFTGGEDVDPALYGEIPNGAAYWNPKRDAAELAALRCFTEDIETSRVKRVFGVCRGLQFLAAAFGGSLHQHIHQPGNRHGIWWVQDSPFAYLHSVNSLHHQAVKDTGSAFGEPGKVLAIEPSTGHIESVVWGNRAIGVQFHPEFFDGNIRNLFFSSLIGWAEGDH